MLLQLLIPPVVAGAAGLQGYSRSTHRLCLCLHCCYCLLLHLHIWIKFVPDEGGRGQESCRKPCRAGCHTKYNMSVWVQEGTKHAVSPEQQALPGDWQVWDPALFACLGQQLQQQAQALGLVCFAVQFASTLCLLRLWLQATSGLLRSEQSSRYIASSNTSMERREVYTKRRSTTPRGMFDRSPWLDQKCPSRYLKCQHCDVTRHPYSIHVYTDLWCRSRLHSLKEHEPLTLSNSLVHST